jgi:sugar transferase (PEP-CTERM/EpsH1 system associated)
VERILYISHCLPYPPDKGERIRAFHEVLALSRQFRVTVACLVRRDGQARDIGPLTRLCDRIIVARAGGLLGLLRGAAGVLAGKSVSEGFFRSLRLKRRMAGLFAGKPFDIVMGYSSAVLPYVLAAPAARRVMDFVDIDSLKWRCYALGAGTIKGWLYRRESHRVAQLERRGLIACDAVICVSRAELEAAPLSSEKLCVVSNGVDSDYFRPSRSAANVSPTIVFAGTMNYRPNAEAACWFAVKVWPDLKRLMPELKFMIVGRDPARQVRRLARLPGVTVTGSVPDVRPYLSSARVAVAPLLIARGVQNKVLEAMAMARPVVASAAALEGLDVSCCSGVFQADAPARWVRLLSELVPDVRLCEKLGEEGREFVRSNYAWPGCMEPLVSLCRRLAAGGKTGGDAPANAANAPTLGEASRVPEVPAELQRALRR